MRIAAISLPELHVEVVRAATAADADVGEGKPLAIVVAPAPLTEAKLLGNTRLDVVSREARALGVQPGQTIAQARARAANLAVRVVRPEAVQGALTRLAEVSLAFGATVSFSFSHASDLAKGAKGGKVAAARDALATAAYGDVVWVDVTGCAHLHAPREPSVSSVSSVSSDPSGPSISPGPPSSSGSSGERRVRDGEAILAARLASVFGGLGHTCAVAIADGPRVAAILARAASSERARARARSSSVTSTMSGHARDGRGAGSRPSDRRREHEEDADPPLLVVPPGKNAVALAPLPVSALPIGVDDARWLAKLGVRTIGELRALPRSALAARLGTQAPVVLGLADGDDRAPLVSYVPPEIPEEETTLEYGIEGSEALTFVAKTLADRLATRLAGRAVAASRIELDLVLDVALLPPGTSSTSSAERVQRIAIELPAPLSSASDLLAALRPKIERAVLRAPVLAAKLRAASLVHKPQAALSLFESQPKAERALPRLVAELAADLGEEAVGKLALGDAWLPEERSRFLRLDMNAKARSARPRRHMLASVPEPTRILDVPVPVPRDAVKVVRHLSRLESVDWWKRVPSDGAHGTHGKKGVDYVHAWVDEGAAWVEIDRATGAARVRGWFD